MKSRLLLLILLPVFFVSVIRAEPIMPEFEHKLMELSIKQNEKGIRNLTQEIKKQIEKNEAGPSQKARLNYLLCFANFQIIFLHYGMVEDVSELHSQDKQHLEKAIELDPNMAEAYAMRALITTQSLPPSKVIDASKEDMAKANELDPGNPDFMVVKGFIHLFRPEGSEMILKSALDAYSKKDQKSLENNWWYLMAYGLLGDLLLGSFKQVPKYDEAYRYIHKALELRPDFGYAIHTLKPFTRMHSPLSENELPKSKWSFLAEDAKGDQVSPTAFGAASDRTYHLFDAQKLEYTLDFSQGLVWFRFTYYACPSQDFGINLMLDTDGNANNGANWFYKNKSFKFDIQATLWLRKTRGRYYGVNALSKASDARERRLASISDKAMQFFFDKKNKQLYVAIKHSDLGSPSQMRVAGATGSNRFWNDDIPDQGAGKIQP